MRPRHLLLMMLTTCCPPDAAKPTTPTGGGGSGHAHLPPGPASPLDTLAEGTKLHGFTAKSVYLDDADQPLGARFVHDSGFTLDYLRVETAPQGFLWVRSFPTSDKGEPHTQEHLLLGKGDRGRRLGSFEAMALAESSAFTEQLYTAYHFHTVAGQDVFWPVFDNQLDAALNPDYTDEEIRREVRNFGVDKSFSPGGTSPQAAKASSPGGTSPQAAKASSPGGTSPQAAKSDDGKLRLEEKGTVYNEMVRSFEDPGWLLWTRAAKLVYGAHHPLALVSGGAPDAIRTMTPEDIRTFHRDAYHLANMGMIAAFPSSMSLDSILAHTDGVLAKQRKNAPGKTSNEADLPKPSASPAVTEVVEYPYSDATNPGSMLLAWPATRDLDDAEHALLGLFLDAFAGDESTTLYKKLVDSKTRVMDLGASGVWSYTTDDLGQPVSLGVAGVKADKLDARTATEVRALVLGELERIAKLPDGDPELAAFQERVTSRVVDLQRRLAKFLDSPPGFGFRGTSGSWMSHLRSLARTPDFKKSLTLKPVLARVRDVLAHERNPWRARIQRWGLLETPHALAAKPSPARRKQLDDERKARIDAELARLQKQYATPNAAATLARYQQDYDAETKRLEDSAKAAELPPLVASVPMTLDDGLHYTTGKLAGIPSFVATFDSMASSRVQLAFRLNDAIPADDQWLLAGFPSLLSDAGVIVDGKPMAADEMRERMRKEILELSVYYTRDDRTGRTELVVAGAGNGAAETRTALGWIRRVLWSPDWRIENQARLRDLVDQSLTGLRARMLGAEEGWVHDPRDAWRAQDPLQAHTTSFLTQMHDLHRLRWALLDPRDPEVTKEAGKFLQLLGGAATRPRAELVALAQALAKLTGAPPSAGRKATTGAVAKYYAAATKLSAGGKVLAQAAGKDLALLLSDLPDGSLAADWTYLTRQMAADLQTGAPAVLAKLAALRARIVQNARTRLVEVGSTASHRAIAGDLEKLVRDLPAPPAGTFPRSPGHPFVDRLREREPGKPAIADNAFVGLLAPGTSSGVFLNTTTASWYGDTGDDAVLDYLASNLYTGHGGHSIFMKTWAAGLAYSNGLRVNIDAGRLNYYAERTPLLPQTLRFVIDQLEKAKADPGIARYAVAESFHSRIAGGYESRASQMAANLVDGETPEVVRAFRTRLLEVAKRPDLATALFDRMQGVYGKVLPGYGTLDPHATYFVIGPDKQLAAYEDYLRATFGKTTRLYRLYPRDFWVPAKP